MATSRRATEKDTRPETTPSVGVRPDGVRVSVQGCRVGVHYSPDAGETRSDMANLNVVMINVT